MPLIKMIKIGCFWGCQWSELHQSRQSAHAIGRSECIFDEPENFQ